MPLLNGKTPIPTKSKEDIKKDLEMFLKEKKHWDEYKIEGIIPTLVPYYFFVLKKVKGIKPTDDGVKIEGDVKFETIKLEVNAENGEISDQFSKVLEKDPFKFINRADDIYEVVKQIINKEKASQIALYYVKSKDPDSAVTVLGDELIYWPIWKFWIKLKSGKKGKEETHLLLYDAIKGKFLNEKDIPERDVPWLEVFFGLSDKLKNPSSWFELGKDAHKSFFKSKKTREEFEIFVIIILIILIVILLLL